MRTRTILPLLGALVLLTAHRAAAAPDGEEVYKNRCARCHERADERIPPRASIEKMPAARILRALDAGAMMAVAMTIDREDRIAVASHLGTKDPIAGPPPSAFCTDRTVRLPATAKTSWTGWSPGQRNARFQPADQAEIGRAHV